jgi:hypothetical protein
LLIAITNDQAEIKLQSTKIYLMYQFFLQDLTGYSLLSEFDASKKLIQVVSTSCICKKIQFIKVKCSINAISILNFSDFSAVSKNDYLNEIIGSPTAIALTGM